MCSGQQTSDLEKWPDIADGDRWPTLLVGNGASINLWGGFEYASLYNKAELSKVAKAVFDDLVTTNFEFVLQAIHHAHVVVAGMGNSTVDIDQQYDHVKTALFDAVRSSHVSWPQVLGDRFGKIDRVIREHDKVFTTNYDLCMYWAHMNTCNATSAKDVVDFFWNGRKFDPNNVTIWSGVGMYYLHGAVHLWQDDQGDNGKWTSKDGEDLLSISGEYQPGSSRWPLFVSEGSSRAKLQSIMRSPYMYFCLKSLRENSDNTVVFGHSLADQDSHIVEALNDGQPRKISVSIYPSGNDQLTIQQKARVTNLLDKHKLSFFDSTSHPLGSQTLRILT